MNSLPQLNRALLDGGFAKPESLLYTPAPSGIPEKVLQFGEGNFLRGFVDWMLHRLNVAGRFGGRVVVVQPIAQGLAARLNEQNGLYTLLLRGRLDGKQIDHRELIDCVSRALNPYGQWDQVLAVARSRHIRVIVSNTTEAGIVFRPEDALDDAPPASFPGKLTRVLFERFQSCGKEDAPGLIILPCELIERNGDNLRKAVLQTAKNWSLPQDFLEWNANANIYANALVDRIVTGYPRDEAAEICSQLGYQDSLLVAAEPFHLWVIEAPPRCAQELPFDQIGLNVIFTDDMTPYRDRKVRILNGAHTMTVPAAFLAGKNTVGELMEDPLLRSFMIDGINHEIIPTLDLPPEDLQSFAAAVVERFGNPFVKHNLLSITANSTSKFKSRILPSIKRYIELTGQAPKRMGFALAALIAFYRGEQVEAARLTGRRGDEGYPIQDDAPVLRFFAEVWTAHHRDLPALVREVLAQREMWGDDLNALNGLPETVKRSLAAIFRDGMRAAIEAL